MSLLITLDEPIVIQQSVITSEIQVLQTTDDPVNKTVKSLVKICSNPYAHNWYTVWEGDAYDAAGQWTDDDLAIAIKDLVVASYPT